MSTRGNNGKTYELRYTGFLTGAPTVYLHYGKENWSDVCEVKMRKLKSCYKTEITVPSTCSNINFCFRDSEGNWDNNNGHDYCYTTKVTKAKNGATETTATTNATTNSAWYAAVEITPC